MLEKHYLPFTPALHSLLCILVTPLKRALKNLLFQIASKLVSVVLYKQSL